MNQPYLFCLCDLCNLMNEFIYWLDFIFLFLELFEGLGHLTLGLISCKTCQKNCVLCQTHYVLKTVRWREKFPLSQTIRAVHLWSLKRWVNFTQASKGYSIIRLQRLMPKYLQALVLVSLCRFMSNFLAEKSQNTFFKAVAHAFFMLK